MTGPDRPDGQDSWQHPTADSDATQVVSAEELRAASAHDAPLPPRPVTSEVAPGEAPGAGDPTPAYEPYPASEAYDSGVGSAPTSTEPSPAADPVPGTAAAAGAYAGSSAASDGSPASGPSVGSPASSASSTGYPVSSDDPDATSVYHPPVEPTASQPQQVGPAGAAAAGYAAGYGTARYGDPEAPRPYETPSYAPQSGPTPTSYSYQDPYGYAAPPAPADQPSVLAPARNRVVIPKLPSRAGTNTIAALIGLLLTFGGLALLVLVPLPNTGLNQVTNKILVILVVVIMMVPALLLSWGAAATFLPGLIFTALSLWLIIGGDYALSKTVVVLGDSAWVARTVDFFRAIPGLAVGLALLFASIAAWMIRRYTRRAIQDALDAEYAAEQMRPMTRP